MGLFNSLFNIFTRTQAQRKDRSSEKTTQGTNEGSEKIQDPTIRENKRIVLVEAAVNMAKEILQNLPDDRTALNKMIPPMIPRTFVFGDVHGDLTSLAENLYAAGLINKQGDWIGNSGDKVIFLGDYIDRGNHSLACYEWIKSLKAKAREKGAEFIMLAGNHEIDTFRGPSFSNRENTYSIEDEKFLRAEIEEDLANKTLQIGYIDPVTNIVYIHNPDVSFKTIEEIKQKIDAVTQELTQKLTRIKLEEVLKELSNCEMRNGLLNQRTAANTFMQRLPIEALANDLKEIITIDAEAINAICELGLIKTLDNMLQDLKYLKTGRVNVIGGHTPNMGNVCRQSPIARYQNDECNRITLDTADIATNGFRHFTVVDGQGNVSDIYDPRSVSLSVRGHSTKIEVNPNYSCWTVSEVTKSLTSDEILLKQQNLCINWLYAIERRIYSPDEFKRGENLNIQKQKLQAKLTQQLGLIEQNIKERLIKMHVLRLAHLERTAPQSPEIDIIKVFLKKHYEIDISKINEIKATLVDLQAQEVARTREAARAKEVVYPSSYKPYSEYSQEELKASIERHSKRLKTLESQNSNNPGSSSKHAKLQAKISKHRKKIEKLKKILERKEHSTQASSSRHTTSPATSRQEPPSGDSPTI